VFFAPLRVSSRIKWVFFVALRGSKGVLRGLSRIFADIKVFFVVQSGFDLPPFYAREPLQKLLNSGSIAQILK